MVPRGVSMIQIECFGASGGDVDGMMGGKGAKICGSFDVVEGEVLLVLVGERGKDGKRGGGEERRRGETRVRDAAGGDAREFRGSWKEGRG